MLPPASSRPCDNNCNFPADHNSYCDQLESTKSNDCFPFGTHVINKVRNPRSINKKQVQGYIWELDIIRKLDSTSQQLLDITTPFMCIKNNCVIITDVASWGTEKFISMLYGKLVLFKSLFGLAAGPQCKFVCKNMQINCKILLCNSFILLHYF